MDTIEDLTGQRFGCWTVIKKAENEKSKELYWLCECSCDNKTRKPVMQKYLKDGRSKSCGCSKKKSEDLTNMRFGKLTALKRVENSKSKQIQWLCKCDCSEDSKVIVLSKSLKDGNTTSCGCVRKEDLTGKIFGRWNVLESVGSNEHNKRIWLCECSCENKTQKVVVGSSLVNGSSQSCGCLALESRTTHRLSNSRIYDIYINIKSRCYNENSDSFSDYGGRGIKVCNEWMSEEDGFINFYNWSISNGYQDDLSIDRIDVNGNYEPNNCRWATAKEQGNNRRNNVIIEIDDKRKTAAQWANEKGIKVQSVYSRIKNGWKEENLLNDAKKAIKHSNVKGITWHKKLGKWQVYNLDAYPKLYVGCFLTLEDAIKELERSNNESKTKNSN